MTAPLVVVARLDGLLVTRRHRLLPVTVGAVQAASADSVCSPNELEEAA
jgi:hypothetical protein